MGVAGFLEDLLLALLRQVCVVVHRGCAGRQGKAKPDWYVIEIHTVSPFVLRTDCHVAALLAMTEENDGRFAVLTSAVIPSLR